MSGLAYLLVEDSTEKASKLCQAISEVDSDAKFESVRNAVEAKEKLQSSQYDVLVLDLVLPMREGSNPKPNAGLQILQDIEASSRLRAPPHIIVVSQFPDQLRNLSSEFEKRLLVGIEYSESSDDWIGKVQHRLSYLVESKRRSSRAASQGYSVDFGILCALKAPELEAILDWNCNWCRIAEFNDSAQYWKGIHSPSLDCKSSIVAAHCGEMGSVASAVSAFKLIHKFRPRYLLMVGVCGGMGEAQLGDVIVGDPVWNYLDGKVKNSLKEFSAAPSQYRVKKWMKPIIERVADGVMLAEYFDSFAPDKKNKKPNSCPKLTVAPMASGPFVVADESGVIKKLIEEQHRGTMAVEMEGVGVMHACSVAPTPSPNVLIIKSVMDFLDQKKGDKYKKFAAGASSTVCRSLIDEICTQSQSNQFG